MASAVKLSDGDLKRLKAEVLRDQLYYLTEELGDPSRYFPFLKSRHVLEANDCDRIRGRVTARERTEEFVETLGRHKEGARGEAAFDAFVEALKRQKVQAHIARTLQKAFAKKKAEAEKRKGERGGCDTLLGSSLLTRGPMFVSGNPHGLQLQTDQSLPLA